MYYYSKKSNKKIVHTADCRYIQDTASGDIGRFETLHEACAQGYRLCMGCSPLLRQHRKERGKLLEFCRQRGLAVHPTRHFISIYSTRSMWKLVIGAEDQIVLYHKNEFETKFDHLSAVQGYHLQGDVLKDSIMAYLEYIVHHDLYRSVHPVQPPQPVAKPAKAAPRKGTKRYKNIQKKIKSRKRSQAIRNVLAIFDSLSAAKQNAAV